MADEIILRIADKKFHDLQLKVASILKSDFKITLIDDSVLNAKFNAIFQSYEKIISLSQDILVADPEVGTKISFFKISRVFNKSGHHIGWHIPSLSKSLIEFNSPLLSAVSDYDYLRCCIVDSDIATGSTKEIAQRLFPGADFFAPIKLGANQDLLDIEDLVFRRSLIWDEGRFSYVSYLENEIFFSRRTSILPEIYKIISNLKM